MRKITHPLPRLFTVFIGLMLFTLAPSQALADEVNFSYQYEGHTIHYCGEDVTYTCYVSNTSDLSGEIILPKKAYDPDSKKWFTVVSIGDPNGNSSGFSNCTFSSVTIPESVTTFGFDAFYYCNLPSVFTIPSSIKSIKSNAIIHCGINTLILNESLEEIAKNGILESNLKVAAPSTLDRSVYSNTYLNVVPFNPNNAIIEDGWIWGPEKTSILFAPLTIEGVVNIPENVTEIGASAFNHCESLKSIIANSVITIGSNAFAYCSSLESAIIGSSVSPQSYLTPTIGGFAFGNCTNLMSISLGSSFKVIKGLCFSGCNSLSSINYDTKEPVTADASIFDDTTYKSATLYMPQATLNKIADITPWNLFENTAALATGAGKFDINGDEEVNISDAVLLVDLVMKDKGDIALHDFNNDKRVDIQDVVILIDEILHNRKP